jgi:hypothetical protein
VQILPQGARDRHHQGALQGDKAMQLHILGLVDHAHPAATELLDDAVMRDGFADQRKLGPPFGAHLRLPWEASQRRGRRGQLVGQVPYRTLPAELIPFAA